MLSGFLQDQVQDGLYQQQLDCTNAQITRILNISSGDTGLTQKAGVKKLDETGRVSLYWGYGGSTLT